MSSAEHPTARREIVRRVTPEQARQQREDEDFWYEWVSIAAQVNHPDVPDYYAALNLVPYLDYSATQIHEAHAKMSIALQNSFLRLSARTTDLETALQIHTQLFEFLLTAVRQLTDAENKKLYDQQLKNQLTKRILANQAVEEFQTQQTEQVLILERLLNVLSNLDGKMLNYVFSAITLAGTIHQIKKAGRYPVTIKNMFDDVEKNEKESQKIATKLAKLLNSATYSRLGLLAKVEQVADQKYYQLVIITTNNFYLGKLA